MSLSEWLMLLSAGAAWAAPLTALSVYTHGMARAARSSLEAKIDHLGAETRREHKEVRAEIVRVQTSLAEKYVRREDLQLAMQPHGALIGELHNDLRELRPFVIGIAVHVGFKNGG